MANRELVYHEVIASPLIGLDIETTGLSRRAEIISAAIAWEDTNGDIKSVHFWLNRNDGQATDDIIFGKYLRETLFNPHWPGRVVFHNLLFDLRLLVIRYMKIERIMRSQFCPNINDTLAASRILKNNKFVGHIDPNHLKCHSLKFLVQEHLPELFANGKKVKSFEETTGGLNILVTPRPSVFRYNRDDVEYTVQLFRKFKTLMTPDEWGYYSEIESKHVFNLFHLTWYGVPFDYSIADKLELQILEETEILKRDIYATVGRLFNISSQQELAKAIFYNPQLTYQPSLSQEPRLLSPLYNTNAGQAQVDINTLIALRKLVIKSESFLPPGSKRSPIPVLVSKVMTYLELEKSRSYLEILDKYASFESDGYRIFPNVSASAASGRTSCTGPNLLGIPKKVTKKSSESWDDSGNYQPEIDEQFEALKDETVRKVIKAPPGFKIASIDINGLDLNVLAHGAQLIVNQKQHRDRFEWLDFLEKKNGNIPDSYFAILKKLDPESYRTEFCDFNLKDDLLNYWAMKPSKEDGRRGIRFIHIDFPHDTEFVEFPNQEIERSLERFRGTSKTIILATSYLMGPKGLAVKLAENSDKSEGVESAQKKLNDFYSPRFGYPEIRAFQDKIANQVYAMGYQTSPFGRKFYAETWDDLNENYRNKKGSDEYEFVLFDQKYRQYWYLKARGWQKKSTDQISNMEISERPFGFQFTEILSIQELPTHIFRPCERKANERQIFTRKKSEDQLEESLEFELNRIAITHEIEMTVGHTDYVSGLGMEILGSLIKHGQFFIPERKGSLAILMYRVKLNNPATRYFKMYKPLLRSAKSFFPLYCQGVAATVAKLCLTRARQTIERELPEATILFFIHDQMDVLYPDTPEAAIKIEQILVDAIEDRESKYPFCGHLNEDPSSSQKYAMTDIEFTGTLKLNLEHFQ